MSNIDRKFFKEIQPSNCPVCGEAIILEEHILYSKLCSSCVKDLAKEAATDRTNNDGNQKTV